MSWRYNEIPRHSNLHHHHHRHPLPVVITLFYTVYICPCLSRPSYYSDIFVELKWSLSAPQPLAGHSAWSSSSANAWLPCVRIIHYARGLHARKPDIGVIEACHAGNPWTYLEVKVTKSQGVKALLLAAVTRYVRVYMRRDDTGTARLSSTAMLFYRGCSVLSLIVVLSGNGRSTTSDVVSHFVPSVWIGLRRLLVGLLIIQYIALRTR